MSRNLFLVLLLATGVALADEALEAERAAPVAERLTRTEDAAADLVPADAAPEVEHDDGAAEARTNKKEDAKLIDGMSVLGNREAPKALVIVPWKSSEIGDSLGISTMLDDSRQPVDREVFLRELSYYEIRSETTP